MSRGLLCFIMCLCLSACVAPKKLTMQPENKIDYVVMEKSGRTITLWSAGKIVKSYKLLSLGKSPIGHKVQEGDGRTPEGLYVIDEKHNSKRFQKFLRISYPNQADKLYAKRLGVDPGGMVGIHGDKGGVSGFFDRMKPNWTQGCITVRNAAIDEIYDLVDVGTPILIKP